MAGHLVIVAAAVFEVGLWIRARWETYCCHYPSVGAAYCALHWRLVAWMFIWLGGLLVLAARAARDRVVGSEACLRAIEAAVRCYRRLHGALVARLVVGVARVSQRVKSWAQTPGDPPGRNGTLTLSGANTGSTVGGGDGVSANYCGGMAVAWAARVVTVTLGITAGAVVGGVVYLMGAYRLPGSATHVVGSVGPARLIIVLCVLGGLGFGMLAHKAEEGGAPTDGFARGRDIRRTISAKAVRRSATITRPGLEAKAWAAAHSGTLLGWHRGSKLWATLKDVVLVLAPPQTGKTAYMGGRIIDAVGPVVATSTKADIFVHTGRLRARGGRVWVLNTEGLGGIRSNFRWSPLEGCTDPEVASERAGYLLAGAGKDGGENALFWREMNAKLLRCLLLAAAVTGRNMREVWAWINDSADPTPLRILESEPAVPPEWAAELHQLLYDTPERTRQSIYLTLGQAMQFITSPAVASAICPAPGEPEFCLEEFLAGRSTLYLLGSDRPYASLVPLFTAITGHVFEGAKRVAGRAYNGRLDPPLTLALDEAALICPVPLPSMTADSGGRGIQLLIAVQSPSQLYERWGQRGGESIWNNSNAKLIFGGLGHARDLDDLSKVCGERDERVRGTTTGSNGQRSASMTLRRVPVLAPHEIRQLADGKALLLYRNLAPLVIKTEKVWERKDVKAMARRRAQPKMQRPKVEAPKPIIETSPAVAPSPVVSPAAALAEVDNVVVLADRRDDDTDDGGVEELAAGGEE